VSQTLKQKKLAKMPLLDEKRVISFEEYKEIHQMQESQWTEQAGESSDTLRYNEY
jgi:hypothetical protein